MVTMEQVAVRAKVSQTTVSHVLGGHASRLKISDKTQKRVLEVAQELGYHRNLLARAMVTGKSHLIGFVTARPSGENLIQILAGAIEVAEEQNYLLKVMHLPYCEIQSAVVVTRCLEWRLAGAMIVGLPDDAQRQLHHEFQQAQLPLALIDNAPLPEWGVSFVSDDRAGIRQAVTHLVELGHRRIAFLGGAPSELSSWRTQNFRDVLANWGLPLVEPWVRNSSWSNGDVIAEGAKALLHGDCPTAIVCSSDVIAMVVMREARAIGLRLPKDLSVTGYSGISMSAFVDPPLTTVYQPFHDIGRAAALHLIQCSENEELNPAIDMKREVILPTQLIVRSSTAPPK